MPFVTHIKSNVKAGCDVELGAKTLIIGANGTGKSTVTDAVSLALLGYVPDLGGKDVAQEGLLMALAPDGSSELYANATMSDGPHATWSTEGKVGKAKKAAHSAPPATVAPLRELREMLVKAGDDKRRAFFASVACKHLIDADIRNLIPGLLIERYDTFADRAKRAAGSKPFHAMDRLIAVRDIANKAKLEASRNAKSAETLLKQVAATASAAPLPGELEAAAREAQDALETYQATQDDTQAVVTAAQHQENLAKAQGALQRLTQELHATDAALRPLGVAGPPAERALRDQTIAIFDALALVAEAQANSGKPHCALCASPVTPQASMQRARDVKAAAEEQVSVLRAHAANDAKRDTLLAQRAQQVASYNEWATWYHKLQQEAPQVAGASEDSGAEREAARLAWQQANERHASMKALADNYSAVQRAQDAKVQHEREEAGNKQLVEACDDVISRLMERSVAGFVARVQKYLPKKDTFALQLEPFKVGLQDGDFVKTALSGAEWSRVLLAIGCVLSEDHELAVLLPEERAYDPKTLRAMMLALGKAPCQIILTSPVKYSGQAPKGWTIIDASKNETVAAGADLDPDEEAPIKGGDDSDDDTDDVEVSATLLKPGSEAPSWVRQLGRCVGTGVETDIDQLWAQAFPGVPRMFRKPRTDWQYQTADKQDFGLFDNGAVVRRYGKRIFLYAPSVLEATDPAKQNNGALPADPTELASAPLEAPVWVMEHGKMLADSVRSSMGLEEAWESHYPGKRRAKLAGWRQTDGHEWVQYSNLAVLHSTPHGSWYLYAAPVAEHPDLGSAAPPSGEEASARYMVGDFDDGDTDVFVN